MDGYRFMLESNHWFIHNKHFGHDYIVQDTVLDYKKCISYDLNSQGTIFVSAYCECFEGGVG